MSKSLKTILIVLGIVALIGAGFGLARLLQDNGDPHEKDITFAILVAVAGDYTVDMSPKNPDTGEPEVRVTRGAPAVFDIALAMVDGFDVPVDLEVTGLPDGSYSFSVNPIPVNGTSRLTIQTTALVSNTAYVCTLTTTPASGLGE